MDGPRVHRRALTSLPGKRRATSYASAGTASGSSFLSESWSTSFSTNNGCSSATMRTRTSSTIRDGFSCESTMRPLSSSMFARMNNGAEHRSRPNSRAQLNRAREKMVAEGYLEGPSEAHVVGSRGAFVDSRARRKDIAMASLFSSSSDRLDDKDLDILLGSKSKPSTPSNSIGTLSASTALSSYDMHCARSGSRRRRRPQTSGDISSTRSRDRTGENIFAPSPNRASAYRGNRGNIDDGNCGDGGGGDDDDDDDDLGISARSKIKKRAVKFSASNLPPATLSIQSETFSRNSEKTPVPKNWSTRVLSCGSNGSFQSGGLSGKAFVSELESVKKLHENLESANGEDYVLHISAGLTCSIAATSNGEAYAWGALTNVRQKGSQVSVSQQNVNGFQAQMPTRLILPTDLEHGRLLVQSIACGHEHAAIISRNGMLLTWGNGRVGCLGHGDENSIISPKIVEGLMGQSVTAVCCGAAHTVCTVVFVDENRQKKQAIFSWGSNRAGQLGLGSTFGTAKFVPTQVHSFTDAGLSVSRITCGMHHTLAVGEMIDEEDACWLYSWGFGEDGRLGIGDEEVHFEPLQVPLPGGRIISIGAGEQHSLALLENSKLFAWGSNKFGQLGIGRQSEKELIPIGVPLSWLRDKSVEVNPEILCGARHSGLVTESGKLFLWGWGEEGQLGNRSERSGFRPKETPIPDLLDGVPARICSVALGGSHTLVLCHNAAIKRKALLDLQEVDTQMYHQEPQVEAVPDPPKSPINHIEKEAILVNDEELEEPVVVEEEIENVVETPKRNERAMMIVMRERQRREEERKKRRERQQRILMEQKQQLQQQQQQEKEREEKDAISPLAVPLPQLPMNEQPDLPLLETERFAKKKIPQPATMTRPKSKQKIGVFYKGSPQKDIMDQLLVANSAQAAMRRKQRREEKEVASRQRARTVGAGPNQRRRAGVGFSSSFQKSVNQNIFGATIGAKGQARTSTHRNSGDIDGSSATDLRREMIERSMADGAIDVSKSSKWTGTSKFSTQGMRSALVRDARGASSQDKDTMQQNGGPGGPLTKLAHDRSTVRQKPNRALPRRL